MKNLKTKIKTLLIGTIITVICSSFLVTNFAYAAKAKKTQPATTETTVKTTETYKNNSDQLNKDRTAIEKEIADLNTQISKLPGKKPPTAKQQKNLDDLNKKKADLQKKLDTINQSLIKITEEKVAQDKFNKDQTEKEDQCIKDYGTSCAQHAQESNSNDLTNGTFSVTDNLTLDNGEQPKKYFSDTQNSPIVSLVITVIDFAITIMGSIAVILLIVAGFMFMLSQGNSQKLDEAKDIVKYAAIGLIVALMAYVLTIFVQSIFVNG